MHQRAYPIVNMIKYGSEHTMFSLAHIIFISLILLGLIFGADPYNSVLTPSVHAHPADEFCTRDSGLDPALCRALEKADNAKRLTSSAQFSPDAEGIDLDRNGWETALLYLKLGFLHIIPKGADHIVFVLALFFATSRLRPLLWQISAFTLAHSITLALAAQGWINAPAHIIEPIIALSIAFVAIENLIFKDMTRWRPAIVFGFGLFHGLGFAGVLAELGLPQDQFFTALISFNIGVELGQIAIIALAIGLLFWAIGKSWYRQFACIPAAILIGLIGLYWSVERIFLA